MPVFLLIGGIGIVLLLIAVLVGDVLGTPDRDATSAGRLTGAVAGFLAAFGFGAALTLRADDVMLLAVVAGLIAGSAFGLVGAWVSRTLHRTDDDETA